MGNYSNLGKTERDDAARVPASALSLGNVVMDDRSGDRLRFPAEDEGQSLAAMARQDLQLALQLLAERAQYITGASGAAIALREGDQMICIASAGPCAPEQGSELQINTGLTAESVRTRQVLRCSNADNDPRVNRESCRALGIISLMVVPLLREEDVIGVFELLADRAHAFEERDVIALRRLSEMILTAVEHAEAAEKATEVLRSGDDSPAETKPRFEMPDASPLMKTKVNTCSACGFPVSEGRTLCMDCDGAGRKSKQEEAPAFLSQLIVEEKSWWGSPYGIGTLLLAGATLSFLVYYLR